MLVNIHIIKEQVFNLERIYDLFNSFEEGSFSYP